MYLGFCVSGNGPGLFFITKSFNHEMNVKASNRIVHYGEHRLMYHAY